MAETRLERFADFACHLQIDDLPSATRDKAALHLIDTLAAGVAGSAASEARRIRAALLTATGPATVWGTSTSTAATTAALLNGIAAHAYELDDSGGCDHSGAVVVPAVLAAAATAAAPVEHDRLILATVLGYDLGRRLQDAMGGYDAVNNAGWHSTAVCGPFAAAAAAAFTLRLDSEQTANAIALASTAAAGTWAFVDRGAMSKRLHVGHAAQAGVEAALLAAAGYTGPVNLFEASWGGFLDLYADPSTARPDQLTDRLGASWRIDLASIKPHATCRSTHAAIDALLELKRRLPPTEKITHIEVATSQLIADMCGGTQIDSLTTAQLSLAYSLALADCYERVELDDIIGGQTDPVIAANMASITIAVDPRQSGGSALPYLTVTTSTGRVHHAQAARPLGGWDNPLSPDAVCAKARRLLTRVLPLPNVDALDAAVTGLSGNAAQISALLGTPAE